MYYFAKHTGIYVYKVHPQIIGVQTSSKNPIRLCQSHNSLREHIGITYML